MLQNKRATTNWADGAKNKSGQGKKPAKTYDYKGKKGTISELIALTGGSLTYKKVHSRLQSGHTIEEALSPTKLKYHRPSKEYTYKCHRGTLEDLIALTGNKLTPNQVKLRMDRGFTLEEALKQKVPRKRHVRKPYTYNGFTGSLKQIHELSGTTVKYGTFIVRVRTGYTIEESLNPKLGCNQNKGNQNKGNRSKSKQNNGKKYTFKGVTGTLKELWEFSGTPLAYSTIINRLQKGYTLEEAFYKNLKGDNGEIFNTYTYKGYTDGITGIIKHFSLNITYSTVYSRLRVGMSVDEAFNDKPLRGKQYSYNGVTGTLRAIVKISGTKIPYDTVKYRIHTGYTLEDALTTPLYSNRVDDTTTKEFQYKGYSGNLKTIITQTGGSINYETAIDRLRRGWTIEDVMNPKFQGGGHITQVYSYKGYRGSITDILKTFDLQITYNTVWNRMRKGYTLEEALDTSKGKTQKSYKECKKYLYEGYELSLVDIHKLSGTSIKYSTFVYRVSQGYTLEEALTSKPKRGRREVKKFTYLGYEGSLSDIVKLYGKDVTVKIVRNRLAQGFTLEEALTKEKGYKRTVKQYEYKGYRGSLKDIMKATNCSLSYSLVSRRLREGYTLEDALKPTKRYEYKGYKGSIEYIIKQSGLEISPTTVRRRIKEGYTLEEALKTGTYSNK